MHKKLKEIAKFVNGELVGDGEITVNGVSGINEAKEGELSFILSSEYAHLINLTRASCVVVPKDIKPISNKPLIKVENPPIAFSQVIEFLLPDRIPHPKGIDKTAIVSKDATLGRSVALGPYVVIESGAVIGDNTIIYSFVYIGKNTRIGKNCLLYPNVTIREEITVGNRVTIHPGTVVGSDGFGYNTQRDGTHVKIPQLGTVVIEDDCELGACVTVDRARFTKTVIGKGTKIDNLCQIAHNVTIGPYGLIAAQSGISGSVEIGRNAVFGGQVGVVDHVKVGDFVRVSAQSGITKSFPSNSVLYGMPARPQSKAREIVASVGLLPKLYERVRALENKIKELASAKTKND